MTAPSQQPDIIDLTPEQIVGHADHWRCFTHNISDDVPNWLREHIDTCAMPKALAESSAPRTHLLLTGNTPIHLNQLIELDDQQKPTRFMNAYPCVDSPYGRWAMIESIYQAPTTLEAVLRLQLDDGTVMYAFDPYYSINREHYRKGQQYYVNLSALAYEVSRSKRDEVIVVDDPEAIRYHRAFNAIMAQNNGNPPADLQAQIAAWQPAADELPLAPIHINVGDMCAYLFGDTIGQQDEAWCQGQVIGKSATTFDGQAFVLLDVVILRESLDKPVVIRLAVNQKDFDDSIQVNDYIQANIWLQGIIYQENQTQSPDVASKSA